jgi:hypothetical protein
MLISGIQCFNFLKYMGKIMKLLIVGSSQKLCAGGLLDERRKTCETYSSQHSSRRELLVERRELLQVSVEKGETQVGGEEEKLEGQWGAPGCQGQCQSTMVQRPVPRHSGDTRVLSSSEREKNKRVSD